MRSKAGWTQQVIFYPPALMAHGPHFSLSQASPSFLLGYLLYWVLQNCNLSSKKKIQRDLLKHFKGWAEGTRLFPSSWSFWLYATNKINLHASSQVHLRARGPRIVLDPVSDSKKALFFRMARWKFFSEERWSHDCKVEVSWRWEPRVIQQLPGLPPPKAWCLWLPC